MTEQEEKKTRKWLNPRFHQSILMVAVITTILTLPLFIILYRYVPILSLPIGEDGFRLDHILTFLLLYFAIYFLVRKFRLFFYGVAVVGLIILTITNFSGHYTLSNLYHDYAAMLSGLTTDTVQQKFNNKDKPFARVHQLKMAIDYKNPEVIQWARNKAVLNFQEDANLAYDDEIVKYFSIFKEIYGRWIYVYDPRDEDYYSEASVTLKQLESDDKFKGDCDDYSIMVAAAIKAIGGEVRLIRTTVSNDDGTETGHMYPEVKIGDEKDLEQISYLIKNVYFVKESSNRNVYYYIDTKGYVWLNFDYNDPYPGGRYQSKIRIAETLI